MLKVNKYKKSTRISGLYVLSSNNTPFLTIVEKYLRQTDDPHPTLCFLQHFWEGKTHLQILLHISANSLHFVTVVKGSLWESCSCLVVHKIRLRTLMHNDTSLSATLDGH